MTDRRLELALTEILTDIYVGPMPAYRDDVLAWTAGMRQRRSWMSSERWYSMAFLARPASLIVAAAVAAAIIVGGAIIISRTPPPTLVGAPTVPPSAPVSLPSGDSLPADLVGVSWVGQPREIPQLSTSPNTKLEFFAHRFDILGDDYGAGVLDSGAASAGPNEIRLNIIEAEAGCQVGDVGLYDWTLSPGKTQLTFAPKDGDACGARTTALSGTWYRQECKDPNDLCLGALEAGTYPSRYIDPRLDPGGTWAAPFGRFLFTVPAGWAESADAPDALTLTPSADYANATASGPPDGIFHGIAFQTQPAAMTQNDACTIQEDRSVPRTVDGLVGWLSAQSSLVVTSPTAITIGGYAGRWVDASLAPTWKGTCPGSKDPASVFLTKASGGADGWSWGILGRERQRLILLDLGGGDVLLIDIDSTDPAVFDDLVAQSMPIVSSLTFP